MARKAAVAAAIAEEGTEYLEGMEPSVLNRRLNSLAAKHGTKKQNISNEQMAVKELDEEIRDEMHKAGITFYKHGKIEIRLNNQERLAVKIGGDEGDEE